MAAFRRAHSILALILAPVCCGCGDEETQPPGVLIDDFVQAFHEASCAHLVQCNFVVDMSTCLDVIAPDPGFIQATASAKSGGLTYDPAAARACVDTVAQYACTGDSLFPRSMRETCDKVFGGRRGEGEPCFHAAECQGLDAVCEGACSDDCCEGTCRLDQGLSKLGEPCDTRPCAEGAYCKAGAMGPVCTNKVGPGESCEDSPYACPEGYACDPSTATCFKQADPGASCNPELVADGCFGLADYCDVEAGKCVAMPTVGEGCVSNAVAANFCAGSIAFCGADMTCTSWPKEGEACPQDFCLGGNLTGTTPALACQGGTCVRQAEAVACTGP